MVNKVDNPMSGKTRWTRSSAGMEHPDDSILLAYTREQSLDEGGSSIHQHIDVCEKCCQRCIEYAKIGAELSETLELFQRNQDYPPLTESIFEFIDNPAAIRLARRQREEERRKRYPARSAKWQNFVFLRPALAPLGALLVLVLLVAIALAHGTAWSYINPYILHQGRNGTVIPSVATVASHPSSSATGQPSGAVSATETADRAKIRLCTTSADKAQSRMRLCGTNFTPGDKVQLVVHLAGGDARTRPPVLVDAQGHFQDSWVVATCKDVPVAIEVQDETGSTVASWELRGKDLLLLAGGRC